MYVSSSLGHVKKEKSLFFYVTFKRQTQLKVTRDNFNNCEKFHKVTFFSNFSSLAHFKKKNKDRQVYMGGKIF